MVIRHGFFNNRIRYQVIFLELTAYYSRGHSRGQARHHTYFQLPCGLTKMPLTSLEQIIPELRDAIGPVILISGVERC